MIFHLLRYAVIDKIQKLDNSSTIMGWDSMGLSKSKVRGLTDNFALIEETIAFIED